MKKIKNLWENNKVLIVLGLILVACLVAILIVSFSYFFGGSKNEYGDRLQDIEKYPITETIKNEYVSALENEKIVKDVKMHTKGKIIYITIDFNADTSLNDAEAKATSSLTNLSEDILSYYDINITLKCDKSENSEGFVILGARNVAGSGLVWNNNTPVESEEK